MAQTGSDRSVDQLRICWKSMPTQCCYRGYSLSLSLCNIFEETLVKPSCILVCPHVAEGYIAVIFQPVFEPPKSQISFDVLFF